MVKIKLFNFDFLFQGRLETTHCSLARPLEGVIKVCECDAAIRSVEVQLIRVETVVGDRSERAASEVQNIQIADGDIPRGWEIPVRTVFPRLISEQKYVASLKLRLFYELSGTSLAVASKQASSQSPSKSTLWSSLRTGISSRKRYQ